MAALKSYFPQIFRKITAKTFWRMFIILIVASILLFQLGKFGQNLYQTYQRAQTKQAEKQNLEAQIARWQQVAAKRPDFRDAYFELAVLTYRLNRLSEAKYYLNKTLTLDPNFEPARELEKVIRDK
ncbi:hypothetical protein HYT17_00125 [Candidatus Microgenomates bacterium]|nr:hypothetical protein [Candidatus Microgenomates bacterium]